MIHPVLLCGGSGTRLWPLSRRSYPKQFSRLTGEESLFQAAARRLSGPGFAAPLAVTGDPFRFIVTEQLAAIEQAPAAILIEPAARNTAPAVLAAALWLAARDPGAVLLAAPSDHVIPDAAAFRATVRAALPAAQAGRIVTFGIAPDRAETGYGWLEPAAGADADADADAPAPRPLARFVEKPDAAAAARMLASGRWLWNAGLFLMAARVLIDTVARLDPALLAGVRAALDGATADLGFTRLAPDPWAGVAAISLDYAVMERADNLAVMPHAGSWSDLGDWNAVWRAGQAGPKGTVGGTPESMAAPDTTLCHGPATAIDCAGTLLRAEADGQQLVGIGLRDIVAIAMPDAVLVADRSRAQEVRRAVAALRDAGAVQADTFPRHHRPWGWFESLVLADRFQVKRIVVHPGAALSLQSHRRRAEHWVVVEGTARVTIGDRVRRLSENQSVYIPVGVRHRLENPGTEDMVLIEVQTGAYLGEDDIIRHEDAYRRG